jgi:adenine-specific DNA-methyltransferase
MPFVTAKQDLLLDFFAGSGTTGHAVINLNRADGGQRKFILVEMGEYFATVLLPRIAKVIYTPAWKEGRPQRPATAEEAAHTPRLVKLLRLESYDDALHNLAATAAGQAAAPAGQARTAAVRQLVGEAAWRLRYWIELPLQEAATCLRAFDLAQPFDYTLETLTDAGPVAQPVDVVETFNLLYGLRVRRYRTWQDGARAYRVVQATDRTGRRRILVLWRNQAGVDPAAERAFLESQLAALAAQGDGWDEILINGDSATPGVASLDPLFKRLMMGEGA